MHDPLEDWAEKDRLLAEIGVEPATRADPEPPPPPPPPLPSLGPPRLVRRSSPVPVDPPAPPPEAPRFRRSPLRRHAIAAVAMLGVGVVWLAAGVGAGSLAACLAGLAFLSLGAVAAVRLNNA